MTIEREPSGPGHVVGLGLDPFASAATNAVVDIDGQDVRPDYALYRQMFIS